jgi:hypothetical protein
MFSIFQNALARCLDSPWKLSVLAVADPLLLTAPGPVIAVDICLNTSLVGLEMQ